MFEAWEAWFRRAGFTGIGATTEQPENALYVPPTEETSEKHKSIMIPNHNYTYNDLKPEVTDGWHGYVFRPDNGKQEAIFIGRLPGRKSYAMYIDHGDTLEPLSYFKSRRAASIAMKWLDRLAQSYVRTGYRSGGDE